MKLLVAFLVLVSLILGVGFAVQTQQVSQLRASLADVRATATMAAYLRSGDAGNPGRVSLLPARPSHTASEPAKSAIDTPTQIPPTPAPVADSGFSVSLTPDVANATTSTVGNEERITYTVVNTGSALDHLVVEFAGLAPHWQVNPDQTYSDCDSADNQRAVTSTVFDFGGLIHTWTCHIHLDVIAVQPGQSRVQIFVSSNPRDYQARDVAVDGGTPEWDCTVIQAAPTATMIDIYSK